MRFTIFQDSRQGDRDGNEDRVGYSFSREVLLMVVADGMGGHQQGEVAAEIAVNEIQRRFQQEARNRLRRPQDFLVGTINEAHRAIVSHAVANSLLECPRTTCVACIVQDGIAYWAHAGDSRLYLLRGGRLIASTQDHSRVQQMIDSGSITQAMAATHPERNKIYSCLGGVVPPIIAVGGEHRLEVGDTIVLCTDGFWGQIPPTMIANLLRKQDVVGLLPGLLDEAHRRANGESDNLSVVAMTWEAQDDPRFADTQSMEGAQFTTSFNSVTMELDRPLPQEDVTDEEIEKAIAEIQSAIKRVPR
jgi:serine/threonine protein phosphatase PrpC